MPTQEGRYLVFVVNSVRARRVFTQDACEGRAKKHIKEVLMRTSFVSDMIDKVNETNNLLTKIQQSYREHTVCLKNRFEGLVNLIWEPEIQAITMTFMKYKKKHPEYGDLVVRLNIIHYKTR